MIRTLFIILGIALLVWGAMALVIALSGDPRSAEILPRHKFTYVVFLVLSGAAFFAAGVRRYALNIKFFLSVVWLSFAVYTAGPIIEVGYIQEGNFGRFYIASMLLIAGLIGLWRAHKEHESREISN